MLMLMLDDARVQRPCLDRDGKAHILSVETCDFILGFALRCMSAAEARLCLRPKTFRFTEDQDD